MRLARPLRKLLQVSWADRRLALEALAWLGVMRLAVRWVRFERLARWLRLEPGESPSQPAPPAAQRVGWAVRGVAAHTPWQSACLVQALAAAGMLQRRGLDCTLYLGAARSQARPAELLAHAWLRCGPHVLTGESESRRFPVLARFTPAGQRAGESARHAE
jgi:hypothetical protein